MLRRVAVPAAASAAACLAANTTFLSESMRTVTTEALVNRVKGALENRKDQAFDVKAINTATNEFVAMGFDGSYSKNFSTAEVAEHVHGFLCAKATRNDPASLSFGREGEDSAFYICNMAGDCNLKTLAMIEAYIKRNSAKLSSHALSLRSYHGTSQSGNDVVLFDVRFNPFKDASGKGKTIEDLASVEFAKNRTPGAISRYAELLPKLRDSIVPVYNIKTLSSGNTVINIAFNPDRDTYLTSISSLISNIPDAAIVKKFVETFSNGAQVYSFYTRGVTEAQLVEAVTLIGMLPNRPSHPYTRLYNSKQITAHEVVYAYAVSQFAYYFARPVEEGNYAALRKTLGRDAVMLKRLKTMRNSMFQELMDEGTISKVVEENVPLFRAIYADFEKGPTPESTAALMARVTKEHPAEVVPELNSLFKTFVQFNQAVKATNFFKTNRAAVAYRLDPSFLANLDFPRVPYGVYLIVGSHFRGFHVRFHDIARGGVRMMFSKSNAEYKAKRKTLFQENYGLSFTQMLKNKDIPESGSKGTLLVSPRFDQKKGDPHVLFLQYVDALLDIMVPGTPGVRNTLEKRELLFLGPDENTAGDYPSKAALYSKGRGFPEWKSLTTGKDSMDGGIPHDVYGMTTTSVREYLLATYERLGWKEEELVKFQTGGPKGDLGSNEILLGKEIQKAMCDITGCLYDPEGLNREELVRMATAREELKYFDKSKLSKNGFFLPSDAPETTLPDGTTWSGPKLLSRFHLTDYATADVFVPCGGRPNSVTLDNVAGMFVDLPGVTGEMMLEGGGHASPDHHRFKLISEGANLFITPDARVALENEGVILFKDSSANKGGVTSSSYEVYTGLAMSDEDHAKMMCCSTDNATPMYQAMVDEILVKIRQNARSEFAAIERDVAAKNLKGHRQAIADAYSNKIVDIFEFVSHSHLSSNDALFRYVLTQYTPKALLDVVPLDTIIERVPRAYLEAIFNKQIASNYVYSAGAKANEFAFYEYMDKLKLAATAAYDKK